jgi:hypothetical protein
VYFLVRQDGSYLIKQRDGEKTSQISKGWVADATVKKPDAKGSATNLLEIDHKWDPSKVVFLVKASRCIRLTPRRWTWTETSGYG